MFMLISLGSSGDGRTGYLRLGDISTAIRRSIRRNWKVLCGSCRSR